MIKWQENCRHGKGNSSINGESSMNSVLSALPTYFLTVFALKKWVMKKIDKGGISSGRDQKRPMVDTAW